MPHISLSGWTTGSGCLIVTLLLVNEMLKFLTVVSNNTSHIFCQKIFAAKIISHMILCVLEDLMNN